MAYLKWEYDLDTGIEVIDTQHKRIVEMINHLHDAQQSSDREQIGKVIEEVADYTLSHFAFEESLMEEAGYQFTRPHKRVHEIFIRRVTEYAERFKKGEDVAEDLKGLLSRWLFNHIRNDDAAYVDSVKENMRKISGDRSKGGWLSRAMHRFFG